MKKILMVILCAISALILTGCGHNLATQSKGWGIDVTWNPDAYMPSLRLGYWDISYAMMKENTEVEMTSEAGLKADTGNGEKKESSLSAVASGTVGNKVVMKTGAQTNGYVVDVLTSPNAKDNDNIAKYIYGVKTEEKK